MPNRYPTGPRSRSAEGLHQGLALGIGEVGVDQGLVDAAEPLAQTVELALLGDEEQRRRTFHHFLADPLEVTLRDAGAVGGLAQRADRSADDAADDGHEEQRPGDHA